MVPVENNAHFVDVTRADGVYVSKPVEASEAFDPGVARRNSERVHAILTSERVGEQCLVYFPPGRYYFDGAADGWQATIETTARNQTIAGAGMNATRIFQADRSVAATIRLRHDQTAVRDLFLGSADTCTVFQPLWEDEPHRAAVHIDAPVGGGKWYASPRIERLTINSYGNSISQDRFSRPFEEGIRITGTWLDVYVRQVWMTDTFTGFYVDQGAVMAGPAKILEVNHYSTHAKDRRSRAWTTFFKSETNFMEQVELLDCMFIGAQFVYMDGRPRKPHGPHTPVYNMVISRNYINVYDVGDAPEAREPDARWSGLYFCMPAQHRENAPPNYSRDIRFVDNSCTGRAPRDGAFFYVEGMLRGLTIEGNDISSAGAARCIQIRAMERLDKPGVGAADDIAIRDVKVTNNYFRSYRNIITVGMGHRDPMLGGADGAERDPFWVQRIIFANNQSMMEGGTEHAQLTACHFDRVRQLVLEGNTLAPTPGVSLAVQMSEDVIIQGNALAGTNAVGSVGILLADVNGAAIAHNTLRGFERGIAVRGGQHSIMGNIVSECGQSLAIDGAGTDSECAGNILNDSVRKPNDLE